MQEGYQELCYYTACRHNKAQAYGRQIIYYFAVFGTWSAHDRDNELNIKPSFEVLPLKMFQIMDMAKYFYGGKKSDSFDEFCKRIKNEEIVARVGGTPLTALLLIVYFEIFMILTQGTTFTTSSLNSWYFISGKNWKKITAPKLLLTSLTTPVQNNAY